MGGLAQGKSPWAGAGCAVVAICSIAVKVGFT